MATFPGATIDECNGNKALRTTICQEAGDELNVAGSFAPSGLRTALEISNETVGDTATAVPLTPLTNRNSIIIFNQDPVESLFIGNADVTASGVKEGWIIDAGSYFSVDITELIVLYAIAPTGKTISVKIMEFA